jgi:hypothetical protein
MPPCHFHIRLPIIRFHADAAIFILPPPFKSAEPDLLRAYAVITFASCRRDFFDAISPLRSSFRR